ncbi:MAG: hypothetical protein IKX36_00115 [Prevotella sp.]|nr:hypothetical protein [Prevotella sp.]
MNNVLKQQPAERISKRIFIALLAVIAVVFVAFYLIGFNRPYADDPNFNEPLLTDVVLVFMFLILLVAIAAAIWGMVRAMRMRDDLPADNGVKTRPYGWIVAGGTVALMALTFLLGSTAPIWVNGAVYDNAFWLKTANMFVWSTIIMLIAATVAAAYYTIKSRKNN